MGEPVHHNVYSIVKNFGGESLSRLSIYSEGNQGKTEKLADKL